MNNLGNILIFTGFLIIIFGLIFKFLPQIKLPGDIFIQKKNFTFYFPVITCIVFSIILSLLFYFFIFFLKK